VDLVTGHLEDAKPVYQNWVAPRLQADILGIHMDIRTLSMLTSDFES
jgi:hypothetical protein